MAVVPANSYEDNEANKQKLVQLLNSGCSMLLVGSGSSRIVNYPSWPEFVTEMETLTPGLNNARMPLLTRADNVFQSLHQQKMDRRYYDFLRLTFSPNGRSHSFFHAQLVFLNFCGIITTNYDRVLESAVEDAKQRELGRIWYCSPTDLCATTQRSRAFDFMRNLNEENARGSILHLHGFFENPDAMLVNFGDYRLHYGLSSGPSLATFHRKTVWSLLATRPVVFVGFGFADPFFVDILQLVFDDFGSLGPYSHFAIVARRSPDDPDQKRYADLGVTPVCYTLPDRKGEDHSELSVLIDELAKRTNRVLPPSLRLGGPSAKTSRAAKTPARRHRRAR